MSFPLTTVAESKMPPRRGFKQRLSPSSAALEQALASASQAVTPGSGSGGGAAGKKTAGRKHNVWESDAARPGGKTSMQVLLSWLAVEGNYARWASRAGGTPAGGKRGPTRASLIREMLAAFEAEGIQRTMQDVRNRMAFVEKQYAAARAWLRDTGFLLAFERGEADKDVERSVLRLCRHYRELAPRFEVEAANHPAETINLDNSTDENEDAAAPVGREESGDVSPAVDSEGGGHQEEVEEGMWEHEGQEILVEESASEGEQGETAAASDASSTSPAGADREEEEAASSSTSNRADNEEEEEEEEPAQEAIPFEHAEPSEEEEAEAEEEPARREAATPAPKRRRLALLPPSDSEDGDAWEADDKKAKARHRAALLAATEEQIEQRRALFELERAKLRRELELKEIQVAFERTLARQKLLDAGVSMDDINRVLPL